MDVIIQDETVEHPAEICLVVAGQVFAAAMSVPEMMRVHEAKSQTQMRRGDLSVALPINCHAKRLVDNLNRLGFLCPPMSSQLLP